MQTPEDVLTSLLQVVTKAIVDFPDDVHTHAIHGGATIVLELTVARDDIGKVIGRRGNMAGALRTILTNTATKFNKRVVLNIME